MYYQQTKTIKLFIFIAFLSFSQSITNFMPNLPLGEYRVIFDRVYPCEPTTNHSIKYNLYFSNKTSSITELKGNVTFMIPLDDTLTLDVNVASWSLNGGWKPNSIVYITKNACTNMKNVLGNVWYSLIKAFNGPKTSCPFPAGTYITSGVDLKELEDHNAPKVYFYGKYKLLMKIKNAGKKVLGCAIIELNLVRPWEKTI